MLPKAYLPLLLLASLSATPATDAQVTPTWTDVSGDAPRNEEAVALTYGNEGDLYVLGVEDVPATYNRGLYVARVGEDGEAVWETRLGAGPEFSLVPYALYAHGGDSLAVLYGRTTPGFQLGEVRLVNVSRATGEASAEQIIGLPDDFAYQRLGLDTVPGSRDFLLYGDATDVFEERGGNFVARVSPAGEVAWYSDEVAFSGAVFAQEIGSLTVRGDTAYALGGASSVLAVALADGAVGAERELVTPTGSGAGDAGLVARGDSLYVVTVSGITATFSRLGDTQATIASVGLGGAAPRRRIRALGATADSVVTYFLAVPLGGEDIELTRVAVSLETGDAAVATVQGTPGTPAERFSTSLFSDSPQLLAVASDGAVAVAGELESDDGGADGAVARVTFGGGADVGLGYRFGVTVPADDSYVLEVVARSGGGVYVVREEGFGERQSLHLRALNDDGRLVSDVLLRSPRGFGGHFAQVFGAAGLPDGDVLVAGTFVDTLGENLEMLELVRFGSDGTRRAAERLDGAPFYFRPIRAVLHEDEGGRFLLGVGYEDAAGTVAQVFRFDADFDEVTQYDYFPSADTIFSIRLLRPLDGTDDFLLSGQTEDQSSYVARVRGGDGTIEWRTELETGFAFGEQISTLAPQADGRIAVVTFEGLVHYLSPEGVPLSSFVADLPGFDYLILDARYEGSAPLVGNVDVGGEANLPGTRLGILRLDSAARGFRPLLVVPAAPVFAPQVYREIGGRSYVGGVVLAGSEVRAGVMAFGGTLSPVAAATAGASVLEVSPNPAAAGSTVRVRGGEEVRAWEVVDIAGRRVGRVLAKAGEVQLPDVAAGVYFLRGGSAGEEVKTAALVVE